MEPEISVDVAHSWKRLVNLANEARTDPRDDAIEIVESFMVHGNQAQIDQLRNMVNKELATRRGSRAVSVNVLRIYSKWLDILSTAKATLGAQDELAG
jgi:hypothetical protein